MPGYFHFEIGALLAGNPILPARIVRSIGAIAALVLMLTTPALAESPVGGTITGHVRGPGGVSVPGVTIQLVEIETGERKATWTDEAGNYSFAGLKPGTYKLEASLVGFRADVRQPLPVTSGRVLKVNIVLVLGLPEESAAVTGARRNPAEPQSIERLPEEIRGRLREFGIEGNPLAGATAGGEPNVRIAETSTAPGLAGGEPSAGEGDPSASAANSFLLSGGVGRGAPTPGDDEGRWRERVEEFRRARETQSAPGFGGGMGPGLDQVAVFLGGRGGNWAGRRAQVNRIRGNASESYSNSALNARPYPLNVAGSPQIPSYNQQFGFGLGGPLVIPKVYQGRDKTSFFFNYGLARSRNPFDSFATVPTPAERAGDFSQAVIPAGPLAGTVPTIFDPGTAGNLAGSRTPFPGNQVPVSGFDPAAAGLLRFIPLPNLPGSVQNFHLQEALPSANDRVMGRIGHQISSKDALNVFYFLNSSRSDAVSNFPGLTRHTSTRNQNLNLGETHTFSPQTVNTLMLNFNRSRISTVNPFAFREDVSGELGIQGVSKDPRDWGVPLVQYTNFAGLNDTIPSLVRNQTFRVFDMLIWNHGKHNLHVGGELRKVQLNNLTDPDARGTFTFSGFTTSNFLQGFPLPGTGFDFADFLLGLPQSTSVRFGTSSNYFRSWVYSAFVEDDWHVSPRWTLNLGLRYEIDQPFTEQYGHLSNLALGQAFSTATVVTGQSPGALPSSLIRSDVNNFAPRVGLAFRPWKQRKLVLRGGYGIFYDGSIYQRLVPNLANQPPFAEASTLLTSPSRVLTLEQGFPQIAPNVAANTYAADPNFRTPYAATWNFAVEDEIARNLILSLGYVGTKGTKLDLLLGPNRAAPGSPLTTQERLQLANALQFTYETSGAASIYHGLQVGLRRQYRSGLSVSANYTFSKSIDNAASVGGAGRTVAQNNLDLEAERGLSVFDVRHRLVLRHEYELPFGERRSHLNHGGALAGIFGNWQASGTSTLQSGTPFTARVLGNQSNNSGTGASFSERAEATGLPVGVSGFAQTTLAFFNTLAFTLPPPGQFGNAGRNTIPGPRTIDFDMSLSKSVTISREKGVRAEFRVTANNIFNTPSFNGLATVVNAQDFGRVTSAKPMRTVGFSIRLRF